MAHPRRCARTGSSARSPARQPPGTRRPIAARCGGPPRRRSAPSAMHTRAPCCRTGKRDAGQRISNLEMREASERCPDPPGR
eukprot:867061-Pyramimonas_sp.AAC.1